ncbi:CPCC family cysteine-rich protein [Flavobacterium ardleyense]|uniref:CPCC family cysteine-rich protein n=1 Tax=Flavobacterium ardleyense TaxID=2038737 RepID=A0ABW5Z8K7_9FLAO
MGIELSRKEAIRIIQDYMLLHLSIEEKGNILIGYGGKVINEDNDEWIVSEILNIKNNRIIRANYNYSKLITNTYLELKIKEFYDLEIAIISNKNYDFDSYYSCVCCNYIISKKRTLYSICPVCYWEDDFTEGETYSGPNHSSLKDYKLKFFKQKELNSNDDVYLQYYK